MKNLSVGGDGPIKPPEKQETKKKSSKKPKK